MNWEVIKGWYDKHIEQAFIIVASAIIYFWFGKNESRFVHFICVVDGFVNFIVIAFVLFVCEKLHWDTFKYIIVPSSPFVIRPFLSKLLINVDPMLDIIFRGLSKYLRKWMKID